MRKSIKIFCRKFARNNTAKRNSQCMQLFLQTVQHIPWLRKRVSGSFLGKLIEIPLLMSRLTLVEYEKLAGKNRLVLRTNLKSG